MSVYTQEIEQLESEISRLTKGLLHYKRIAEHYRDKTVELKEKINEFDTTNVNRVEIVELNGRGRVYTSWNDKNKVDISFQDDGRTLKVFINKVNK